MSAMYSILLGFLAGLLSMTVLNLYKWIVKKMNSI